MKTHFADLFRYNHKTNVALISACLGAESPMDPKAQLLFSHVMNAHQIWLDRIVSETGNADAWKVHEVDHWLGLHESNHFRTLQVLEDEDLGKVISYTNSKGHQFENSVQDILFHVVNHSTYPRGQVAALLVASGVRVPVSDFIAYKR